MLVPNDILNASRKSGFDHVQSHGGGTPVDKRRWRGIAYGGKLDKAGRSWLGPSRAMPLEAAQDYCDHMNGQNATPLAVLTSAVHEYEIDEQDKDPEYQAALGVLRDRRAQRQGKQGYVYLMTEELPGGALKYAKIGYSVNPKKRVAELQTGNARKLKLLYAMPGTEDDERRLHAKYIKEHVLQEWFRISPAMILEFPIEYAVKET